MLCFASAILGDSTSEALLLANVDAALIPRMFLVNAAFLTFSSVFMISAIDRLDRGLFFLYLCAGQAVMLLAVRLALAGGFSFLYLPLFSYAYVTKILFFTMFWTLANDLIDSRSAGKDFPFIAGGGTLGAIGVSFSIPWILKVVPAENLLIVWSALVIVCAAILFPLWRRCRKSFRAGESVQRKHDNRLAALGRDIRLVRDEPLLRNMAVFYFLIFILLINQHFSFYGQLKSRIGNAAQLASFLGNFNGISMLTTFVLQVTCAGTILKKAGATRSMVLMPAVLILVFGSLMVFGVLGAGPAVLFWAVVAGMGARVAFFDSFFSPNFQLFFSSLPQNIRGRGKMALEGVVKPLAIVTASFWLLIVAKHLPFAVSMGILAAVAVVLLIQTFRIKQHYAGSLVGFLTGSTAGNRAFVSGLKEMGQEKELLRDLEHILANEGPEIRTYIVGILADMNSDGSIGILVNYLKTADPRSKAVVVSALTGIVRDDLEPLLLELLFDSDERVVANAITALGYFPNCQTLAPQVNEFLFHRNNRIRANAIVVLWQWTDSDAKVRLEKSITGMLNAPDSRDPASVLYVIGKIGTQSLAGDVGVFFEQRKEEILSNTSIRKQFVFACSRMGGRDSFKLLLELAGMVSPKGHKEIVDGIRTMIESGHSVSEIVKALPECSLPVRLILTRALFESGCTPDSSQAALLSGVALDELRNIYEHYWRTACFCGDGSNERCQLLEQAVLDELVDKHIENVMCMAAMIDSSSAIRRIFHRLRHDNRHVRARACEVLDNVGNVRLNRRLIELLETDRANEITHRGQELYRFEAIGRTAALQWYRTSTSDWVCQCAEYALSHV